MKRCRTATNKNILFISLLINTFILIIMIDTLNGFVLDQITAKININTNKTINEYETKSVLKRKKKRCRYSDNEIDMSNQKNLNQKLNELKKNTNANNQNNGLTLFTKQPKTRDQQHNQYRIQMSDYQNNHLQHHHNHHNEKKSSSKSVYMKFKLTERLKLERCLVELMLIFI
jgi:hypothetical protein